MRIRRPLIPTSILAAAAAAVLAAGCGAGSSQPTSSGATTAAPTDLASKAVAFGNCVRSHGLPGYPDPSVTQSGGRTTTHISPGTLDPNTELFKSATRSCVHLFPELGAASGTVSPKELLFASCMRGHGVPNFPDPDHDGTFTLVASIDQQDPQFKRAITACATLEPSSLSILTQPPSNS